MYCNIRNAITSFIGDYESSGSYKFNRIVSNSAHSKGLSGLHPQHLSDETPIPDEKKLSEKL